MGAADGGIEQALLSFRGEKVVEGFGDGGVRHARQPEALAGQFALRELVDVVEDEFTFATGIAGVDDRADVGAVEEFL